MLLPLVFNNIENAPPTIHQDDAGGMPRLVPFIDPEKRAAAVLERARAADPQAAGDLEDMHGLTQIYEMAVAGIRRVITESLPVSDEVEVTAQRR
jgi:hypothetical protein